MVPWCAKYEPERREEGSVDWLEAAFLLASR